MRVSLAKDVLSYQVAKSLEYDVPGSHGTASFVMLFDRWFNIVTCRSISDVNDPRLVWLEDTFVKYLEDWEV